MARTVSPSEEPMTTTKISKTPAREARSRREQRKEQHQTLSRLQLLDAAEEVFGRKGFHETTLKEVAELAEFSVGSVYSFFENKDDLFRQIFVRRGDEFMPLIRALLASKRTPLEQLHDLVDFEVGYFRTHPRFGRLFLKFSSATLQSSDRLADELMMGNYEESMTLQADLFKRGQKAKQLVAGDPWVLARLLSGLMAAYQALDPLVMSDEAGQSERMSLHDFHGLVARTFAL
jgi:AcrR family transcriptional regulator